MSEAMEGVKKDVQKEKWRERKHEMRKWKIAAGKMKQQKKSNREKEKLDGMGIRCWSAGRERRDGGRNTNEWRRKM